MKREKLSKAAASGVVALIFLVLGFQAAIFTGNVFKYNREHRIDTVYIETNRQQAIAEGGACLQRSKVSPRQEPGISRGIAPQHEPDYSDSRRAIAEKLKPKPAPKTFEFDPNTISMGDLVRLGFSQKQAQVIENYRNKGGKYTTPRDFSKMYVVDSATYVRLEPFIKIKKLDLNTADSLALIGLRGIGPYYAHKILEYRRNLGGVFTSKEQLLEIDGIDAERLEGFSKMIEIGRARPFFTIWDADRSQLSRHPYIGSYAAKGIIRYKSVTDTAAWSLDGLEENGIIKAADAARLRYLDGAGKGHHE